MARHMVKDDNGVTLGYAEHACTVYSKRWYRLYMGKGDGVQPYVLHNDGALVQGLAEARCAIEYAASLKT